MPHVARAVSAFLLAALVVVPLAAPTVGHADEDAVAALRAEVERLRAEVDALRARVAVLEGGAAAGPDEAATLLVQTRTGVVTVASDGVVTPLEVDGRPVRGALATADGRVYLRRYDGIHRIDATGRSLQTIPVPEAAEGYAFAALPGGGFAILDNREDRVHLLDPTGALRATVPMGDDPGSSLQSVFAIVVDGRLVVSSDGKNRVLAVDLDEPRGQVLREMPDLRPWPGALAHADGTWYLATTSDVYTFDPTSNAPPDRLARLETHNITGMVVAGRSLFVTVNFGGQVVRIDRDTGETTVVAEGLARPDGLVVLPR
jgi:sugar lactone lactonase YvrE